MSMGQVVRSFALLFGIAALSACTGVAPSVHAPQSSYTDTDRVPRVIALEPVQDRRGLAPAIYYQGGNDKVSYDRSVSSSVGSAIRSELRNSA
jgi:hypothetical protein